MEAPASPTQAAHATHQFLDALDPVRLSKGLPDDAARSLLVASLDGALASLPQAGGAQGNDPALKDALLKIHHAVRSWDAASTKAAWLTRRDALSPLYEALVTALRRHGQPAQTLHPTNYKRTTFHVLSGVAVVLAFEHVLTPVTAVWAAGVFCVVAWSMETARRYSETANAWMMQLFKHVARDHERYRVNSSTWYGTALLLIAITCPNRAGMLGVMALAVGDPSAGWVGRRFGRIRLFKGKSLEGTVAFAAASFLGGMAYLLSHHAASLPVTTMVGMCAVSSVVGAVVELFSNPLDDNFTVPLSAGWAALAVQSLLSP